MGPGARLVIHTNPKDASSIKPSDNVKIYSGHSNIRNNDLVLEGHAIVLWFEANSTALPAGGPNVHFHFAKSKNGMDSKTVGRIIFIGALVLIVAYVLSGLYAWRKYKQAEVSRHDAERAAARCRSENL
jgi:hypothetical protein